MTRKTKYVVTDGCFVWPSKNKTEAMKKARRLAQNHYNTWVATPKKTGGLKIIKKFVMK